MTGRDTFLERRDTSVDTHNSGSYLDMAAGMRRSDVDESTHNMSDTGGMMTAGLKINNSAEPHSLSPPPNPP